MWHLRTVMESSVNEKCPLEMVITENHEIAQQGGGMAYNNRSFIPTRQIGEHKMFMNLYCRRSISMGERFTPYT